MFTSKQLTNMTPVRKFQVMSDKSDVVEFALIFLLLLLLFQ